MSSATCAPKYVYNFKIIFCIWCQFYVCHPMYTYMYTHTLTHNTHTHTHAHTYVYAWRIFCYSLNRDRDRAELRARERNIDSERVRSERTAMRKEDVFRLSAVQRGSKRDGWIEGREGLTLVSVS